MNVGGGGGGGGDIKYPPTLSSSLSCVKFLPKQVLGMPPFLGDYCIALDLKVAKGNW